MSSEGIGSVWLNNPDNLTSVCSSNVFLRSFLSKVCSLLLLCMCDGHEADHMESTGYTHHLMFRRSELANQSLVS